MSIATDGKRILAVYAVVNPDKLHVKSACHSLRALARLRCRYTEETAHETTTGRHEVPQLRPVTRDVQPFEPKWRRASKSRCSSSSRSAPRRSMAAPTASTCTRRTRALAGETEQRIYALNAWRETPFFTDRERAALEWTEAVTRVSDTHVPDEIYERVSAHFDEEELVTLTFAVIVINSWNRLAVSFRAPAGTYTPKAA